MHTFDQKSEVDRRTARGDEISQTLHKALRQMGDSRGSYLVWLMVNGKDEDAKTFWSAFIVRATARIDECANAQEAQGMLTDVHQNLPHREFGATAMREAMALLSYPDWHMLATVILRFKAPALATA